MCRRLALCGVEPTMAEGQAGTRAPEGRLPRGLRRPHQRQHQATVALLPVDHGTAMAGYWDERMLRDGGEVGLINDRDYWLHRAAEARLIGSLCQDQISQDIMERL